jgi:excisionase family DNA binding protein
MLQIRQIYVIIRNKGERRRMSALINHTHTLQASPANQRGAALLAHVLEDAKVAPEAEPIRAELLALLHDMGKKGQGFTILVTDKELTPTQAAEVLGVSRTHFMRVLQLKRIPHRMVGTHHRVLLKDVLAYREERERRGKLLDELTQQAQEFDMRY